MLAIAISAAPIFVRLARGMAMEAKATEWVEAARALGNPPWRTAVVHVLPNIVPPLLVQATLAIAEAIIAEASLYTYLTHFQVYTLFQGHPVLGVVASIAVGVLLTQALTLLRRRPRDRRPSISAAEVPARR